ncbi:MAG: esterase-like activity of phytase family protein [Jhaorihella sp.]
MRFGLAVAIVATAIGLARPAAPADPPAARLLGSFVWHHDLPWFGGWSGLEISANGTGLTAISDRDGTLIFARIARDAERISGIRILRTIRLRSGAGAPLSGHIADAEGLAIAPDGTLFVSFEGVHRVARYATPDAPVRGLPRPRDFLALPENGSFEALAIDPLGRVYTMPENRPDRHGQIPVYRWDGTRWSVPFRLAARGGFLPVGADFGPDGRLYLLERDFGIWGFRSRLRRWDIRADRPENETTLLQSGFWTHDNLEGVAIWRDPGGTLRATMISDDNFMFFQRTEIVEYALPD